MAPPTALSPASLVCSPVGEGAGPPPSPEEIQAAVYAQSIAAEAEEIENSENLTHTEVDDTEVGTEDPVEIDQEEIIDAILTPRKQVNRNKKIGKAHPDRKTTDEVVLQTERLLKAFANRATCVNKRGGNAVRTCNCLNLLNDDKIRLAVAKYVVKFLEKKKIEQDQILIDWLRYATNGFSRPSNEKTWLLLPFDTDDGDDDISQDVIDQMNRSRVCIDAMMELLRLGQRRWITITKTAKTSGVAKKHGNTGKKNRSYKDDSEVMQSVRSSFEELEGLGETRATRTVETMTSEGVVGHANRDEQSGIENIYLPQSLGIRPCYYRYMSSIGYDVELTDDAGKYRVKPATSWTGAADKPYVSLCTFYRIWQRDYPHLKISKPVEDICLLCFQFAHRHKSLANHKKRGKLSY